MTERRAWHPLGLAAYPVLYLYAANADETPPGNVLGPLALVLGGVVLVWAIGRLVLGDHRRAALVASAWAVLALSFGHATQLLGAGDPSVTLRRGLLVVWVAAAVGAVLGSATVGRLDGLTRGANLMAGLLVVLAVAGLLSEGITSRPFREASAVAQESLETPRQPRDIFYLVFDRYGGAEALAAAHGVDNRPFEEWLRSEGFFVAEDSFSNYLKTGQSLASSLSMGYLDELAEAQGPGSDDWRPAYRMVADNRVADLLQGQGYRYVHVGSWWNPTMVNPEANLNLTYERRNEFATVLLQTTVVPTVLELFGEEAAEVDDRRLHHEASEYQLDVLDRLATQTRRSSQPTFVFAHVLLPHPPFVFDEQGGYVAEGGTFEDQLEYLNRRIRGLVEGLLAGPDEQDPIVLIQADEGPFPYRYAIDVEEFDWREATDAELRMKTDILNAYYLPGQGSPAPYEGISPVNSFRLVFSRYFGADLELLPDRTYAYVSESHLYDFFEVTDRLR